MALTAEQKAFVIEFQNEMDRVARGCAVSYELRKIYYNRQYGPANANEITDADLLAEGFDFNANDLANGIICAEQLEEFRKPDGVVTNGDYGATMDKLRNLA